MIWLYVQAPFAAFRTFTAGWYRPTASFMTPSAAYGLIMNVAGVETRRDDGLSPMTVTKLGLPSVRIALGAVVDPTKDRATGPGDMDSKGLPTVHTLFQQLHNYPVGASGKERKEDAKGNKYNITPVRREFLAGLRVCIGLDGEPWLENLLREGLSGAHARYGIPFLGDNAFLIDRLELRESPMPARWYRRLGPDDQDPVVTSTTRLTIWIDRQDMSRTRSALYAPDERPSNVIPEDAYWTSIEPPGEPVTAKKSAKK